MLNLLPLNALRAFEAACRHRSFTRAADELGVTPAAVGQQVRGLEMRLGGPLLHRAAGVLTPTQAADRALPMLRQGFEQLAQGFRSLSPAIDERRITVSAAPSFAIKWLVPRLPRFHARHPDVELAFDTAMRFVDIARGEADLAIRFGNGRYRGLRSERLFREWVLPVCSPALAPGTAKLASLRGLPLIHVRDETADQTWPTWPLWCARFGIDSTGSAEGPSFTQSVMALQAALEGQGIALCGLSYALADIEAGRLATPFGINSALQTTYGFDLVYTAARADSHPVRAFRIWMQNEGEATRQRLHDIVGDLPAS